MSAPEPAAKLAESIPAVTVPVKMPGLVPGRARYIANVVTGGVLLAFCIVLMIIGLVVS